MWNFLRTRVTVWVVMAALGLASALILLTAAAIYFMPALSGRQTPLAQMTVIPAPTLTPSPAPTASPAAGQAGDGQAVGGIAVGMFVQITGTGGDGLRLRAGPGTSNDPRFLGYESEVFRVKDGPKFSDSLTWWYLEAPYDPNRAGWAVSTYLKVVAAPAQNP